MIEYSPILTYLTFMPLVGVIIILLLKPFNSENDFNIKVVANLTAVATLYLFYRRFDDV